jgi:hypothetical protein
VNCRKPRVQTLVVSRFPAPAPVDDFVLLFLPPCGPHLTPLAPGSLESGLPISPLLGGPARHRPFAPTLHLHQRKPSRNLHLQYSAKSQSAPRCQSLITAKSDHPPVLGRTGPHRRKPCDPDACPPLRSLRIASSDTSQIGAPHRSDRYPPVRPVRCCCTSIFGSSVLALWINQGTQWFSGEPLETPRTRCSLCQSPLMTRLPRSPGSTLVLRLNQETVHEFILLLLPPCSPHLTPLATGSLKRSILVFSTLGGLTGNDLSCLFFTCTNTSQAATCTCNT